MFDIGFSEMLVIGLVALVVIGPEKLPKVARTLGHLAGRLQRYVSDVKADINREIELDELRKMRDSMQQAASSFESTVQTEMNQTETDLNKSVEDAFGEKPVDGQTAAPAVESKPAETMPDTTEPRQEGAKPDERPAGILHLAPGRAANRLMHARGRSAGGVRRPVHLPGLRLHLRHPRRAAHERAARGRQDDRHRRNHAIHGAGEGHGAGGFMIALP